MSELVRRAPSVLSGREARVVSRDLARLDGHGRLELARVEQAANLQAARVRAVGYVNRRAMHEVAMLSQLEQQLASLVPMATGRLQAFVDLAALGLAEVVSDTVQRVQR